MHERGPALSDEGIASSTAGRRFPQVVFALSFALLLSDFMCRQVLAAVFPALKAEWALSDSQLGLLGSLVAVTVGVLTVPLSALADRFGRRRAIVTMAAVWSLATLGSALATGYGQLLVSRVFVGVGEAAYGSVGLAVVLAVFPDRRRAFLAGAFQAGGSFGTVFGLALGGLLAVHLGWRWSMAAMALGGLLLVVLYRTVVTQERLRRFEQPDSGAVDPRAPVGLRTLWRMVFPPALVWGYLGGGLQLFVAGALLVWLPSYLNRAHGLPQGTAAVLAALLLLVLGSGMIGCGLLTDRIAGAVGRRTWTVAIAFSAASLVLLGVGFWLPPDPLQLVVLGLGAFVTAGTAGPVGALVARLSAGPVRASALGVLALANNLLGLAAGPLVVGVLADRLGLTGAMRLVPWVSVVVIAVLALGRRAYLAGLRRYTAAPHA